MTRRDRIIHAAILVLFFVCWAFLSKAYAQTAPTPSLTYTFETSNQGGTSVVPKLTWSTSPAATSCTASNGWTGTKAGAGTETLPAISATKSYTLSCTWPGVSSCTVTWTAPTTNTDGSTPVNVAGYRIQYGRAADTLDQSAYVNDNAARSWDCPTGAGALASGTWFFGVRAFNPMGLESAIALAGSKTMTAGSSQSRTLTIGIVFPNPPTGAAVQ